MAYRCYHCGNKRPPYGSLCLPCNSKVVEANWIAAGKTCRHCKGSGVTRGLDCGHCVANPFRDYVKGL